MLCEICHKNEATIHIQEIIGGQKKSMHLCSSCAAAKQQGEGLGFDPFNLAGLLYKLSGNTTGGKNSDTGKSGTLVCPICSWDEQRLNASGKVGCENCYKVFAPLLSDVIKNMHSGSSHVGKQPAGKGHELELLHRKLAELQKKLQHSIEVEDYENAAALRDKINELKTQCEKSVKVQKGGGNE
ncbi:MAG: UvrB/UvrC motif-containing protein [Lentisphaeria bacterium]|nr:UvrB/UvrC motif-containing protein [Lentisphaeria bacterium]